VKESERYEAFEGPVFDDYQNEIFECVFVYNLNRFAISCILKSLFFIKHTQNDRIFIHHSFNFLSKFTKNLSPSFSSFSSSSFVTFL